VQVICISSDAVVLNLQPTYSGQLLLDTPSVLLLGFTLPGEDGHTGGSDGSGGVVLGREDVARRPGNLSTEVSKGLNENGTKHGSSKKFSEQRHASWIDSQESLRLNGPVTKPERSSQQQERTD